MGFLDTLLKLAPLAAGGAATLASGGAAAPLEAGLMAGEGAGEAGALGSGLLGMGEAAPAIDAMNVSQGALPVLPPMDVAASMAPPMPAPTPLPEAPGMPPAPTSPGLPTDWQANMKGAHHALRFASKLVPNKEAKNTLSLMALGTGAGANVSDPQAAMEMMGGPLQDIAANQDVSQKRVSQGAPAAPPMPAPTPAPQITQASPATARGVGALPPTRIAPDMSMASPEDRLRMLRGY